MFVSSREKFFNATHDTLLLHHCGMETATPLSAQTQVPGIPSISQVSKTEACGSALAVPVKKYGSLQKAQQELQAVVSAMQAPLADLDSQPVAAQLGTGPLGPRGEPLTPHGNPPKPHCDAPQVNVHDSQSACRVHNLSSFDKYTLALNAPVQSQHMPHPTYAAGANVMLMQRREQHA